VELADLSRGAISRPTFGASLRTARLSRNVTLEAVAAHTKINPGFFRDLERDDLSKWPANQFYRESYLRAYAEAVGLDAGKVIDAFRRELVPAATSNSTAPAAKPRRLTPVTIPIILALTFITAYSVARWMAAPQNAPADSGDSAQPPARGGPVSSSQNGLATTQPVVAPLQTPAPVDLGHIEGELVITSTPPGARVVVNGIGRGPTPVVVRFLQPGAYTVRFVLPGYSAAMRTAAISPERLRVRVSATLKEIPPIQ